MKKIVKITEQQLISMIKEGVENVLQVVNEHKAPKGGYNIYVGNDISYERAYEQAEKALYKAQNENYQINSVLDLIEYQGWKSQSFNQEDWEILYDANEDAFTTWVNENQPLNESSSSIKSRKLLNIINQHGGIYKEPLSRTSHKDIRHVNADLHNLTDDDVLDVVNYTDVDNNRKAVEMIWALRKKYDWLTQELSQGSNVDFLPLNDGTAVGLVSKGTQNDDYRTWAKYNQRNANKPINKYVPGSQTNQNTRNNPYYKGNQYWSPEAKKKNMEIIKQEYDKARLNRPNLPNNE